MHDYDSPRRFRPIETSRKPSTPMPAPKEIREAIEDLVGRFPDWGPKRIESELRRKGTVVPLDMIRTVLAG